MSGWNPGNILETLLKETYWGNPLTIQNMVDVVYDAGFNLVCIHVDWI